MSAEYGDSAKVGTTRTNAKLKQDNRRRMGRKVIISGLRTSNTEDEMYATVSKIFGNGMCEVQCMDEVTRMCIIRKKFRGRVKQSNQVSVGVTVLVGLRQWEKNEKASLPKCDLLEVYSEAEIRKLKQRGGINLDKIAHRGIVTETDEIEFDTTSQEVNYGPNDDIPLQPNRYELSSDEDSDVNIEDI